MATVRHSDQAPDNLYTMGGTNGNRRSHDDKDGLPSTVESVIPGEANPRTDSTRFQGFATAQAPTFDRNRSESVDAKDRSETVPAAPVSPRLALLRATLTGIAEMIEGGDLAGARIAEESLRRLLAVTEPDAVVTARPGPVAAGKGRP